jgi:hypothetical protein
MIREHLHNTAWWGQPVAAVEEAAFFALEAAAQLAALRPYAWAEFKSPLASAPPLLQVAASGFTLVDVQIGFRLLPGAVPDAPSLAQLDCQFADEKRFEIGVGETQAFAQERFSQLPGASPERLAGRYIRWANQLVQEHPQGCVCVRYQGQVQGWFLATPTERGWYLALAMLSQTAQVSGLHLYQKAIRAYAARGALLGFASFSVRNTAVLNIYAQLGARFTPAEGVWLWHPGTERRTKPM